jgi:hypothetical protein
VLDLSVIDFEALEILKAPANPPLCRIFPAGDGSG